jgi:16S rRNA processing protein RimM
MASSKDLPKFSGISASSIVVMARVGAPHGVKGDLKLQVFSEADLSAFSTLWIQHPKKDPRNPNAYPNFSGSVWEPIPKHRIFDRGLLTLIHFEDWNDRDLAKKFTNTLIGVDQSDLPAISSDQEDHEFYWSALIGMRVINQQNIDLGIVDHLFETGANDVMVLKKSQMDADGKLIVKERLLPFIDSVILSVDKSAREIQVDWSEDF